MASKSSKACTICCSNSYGHCPNCRKRFCQTHWHSHKSNCFIKDQPIQVLRWCDATVIKKKDDGSFNVKTNKEKRQILRNVKREEIRASNKVSDSESDSSSTSSASASQTREEEKSSHRDTLFETGQLKLIKSVIGKSSYAKLRRLFKQYDKKAQNQVDANDLFLAISDLGYKTSVQELKSYIFARSGSYTLNFLQFITVYGQLANVTRASKSKSSKQYEDGSENESVDDVINTEATGIVSTLLEKTDSSVDRKTKTQTTEAETETEAEFSSHVNDDTLRKQRKQRDKFNLEYKKKALAAILKYYKTASLVYSTSQNDPSESESKADDESKSDESSWLFSKPVRKWKFNDVLQWLQEMEEEALNHPDDQLTPTGRILNDVSSSNLHKFASLILSASLELPESTSTDLSTSKVNKELVQAIGKHRARGVNPSKPYSRQRSDGDSVSLFVFGYNYVQPRYSFALSLWLINTAIFDSHSINKETHMQEDDKLVECFESCKGDAVTICFESCTGFDFIHVDEASKSAIEYRDKAQVYNKRQPHVFLGSIASAAGNAKVMIWKGGESSDLDFMLRCNGKCALGVTLLRARVYCVDYVGLLTISINVCNFIQYEIQPSLCEHKFECCKIRVPVNNMQLTSSKHHHIQSNYLFDLSIVQNHFVKLVWRGNDDDDNSMVEQLFHTVAHDFAFICPLVSVNYKVIWQELPVNAISLSDFILSEKLYSLSTYVQLFADIALSLNHLHSNSTIHGVLSSDCVYITAESRAMLIGGFSLATKKKTLDSESLLNNDFYPFLTPELYLHEATKLSEASDVFNLGFIMYQTMVKPLLSTSNDFRGLINEFLKHGCLDIPDTLQKDIAIIIKQCTQVNQLDRPSAIEVFVSLSKLLKLLLRDRDGENQNLYVAGGSYWAGEDIFLDVADLYESKRQRFHIESPCIVYDDTKNNLVFDHSELLYDEDVLPVDAEAVKQSITDEERLDIIAKNIESKVKNPSALSHMATAEEQIAMLTGASTTEATDDTADEAGDEDETTEAQVEEEQINVLMTAANAKSTEEEQIDILKGGSTTTVEDQVNILKKSADEEDQINMLAAAAGQNDDQAKESSSSSEEYSGDDSEDSGE